MQDLALQKAQAEVAKLTAEIDRVTADSERQRAITVKTNVDAAYAGMQAGGVATERPAIAPAGDAILKSAGFVDKTPNEGTPAGDSQMPQEALSEAGPAPSVDTAQRDPMSAVAGANVGEHAGIQTPEID